MRRRLLWFVGIWAVSAIAAAAGAGGLRWLLRLGSAPVIATDRPSAS
jgi:hypothetical protein